MNGIRVVRDGEINREYNPGTKLTKKGADWIVANDAFGRNQFSVTLISYADVGP